MVDQTLAIIVGVISVAELNVVDIIGCVDVIGCAVPAIFSELLVPS